MQGMQLGETTPQTLISMYTTIVGVGAVSDTARLGCIILMDGAVTALDGEATIHGVIDIAHGAGAVTEDSVMVATVTPDMAGEVMEPGVPRTDITMVTIIEITGTIRTEDKEVMPTIQPEEVIAEIQMR